VGMVNGKSLHIRVFTALFILLVSLCIVEAGSAVPLNVWSPTLENICSFLKALFIKLELGVGCVRESLIVEPSVCYLTTNFLAEHVLRYLCGEVLIADKIRAFLERYRVDFYGYY